MQRYAHDYLELMIVRVRKKKWRIQATGACILPPCRWYICAMADNVLIPPEAAGPFPTKAVALRYLGKVCIVTGGATGIGAGCVGVFVRNGAKVILCGKGESDGKPLEEEVNALGPGEACYMQCDLTKEDQIKKLINVTVEKYGQIDCLINNAAWHPPPTSIDDFSATDFKELIDLNVVGYFLTSKYALPHLRRSKGCIINNCSLVNMIGQVGAVTYVSTKGAVSAMTRALAVDEAAHGVRVNAFSPSNIWTPMWEDFAKTYHKPAELIKTGQDLQLLGRFGTVEEAGQLCLFLAAEGTFMTGVDIPLSGGAELDYGNKSRLGKGVFMTDQTT